MAARRIGIILSIVREIAMSVPPESPVSPITALLLIAPGCPHCAGMLEGLGALVKEGRLARLEVVNIAVEPAVAQDLGVRSVPWARIGDFHLPGLHTQGELRHWTEMAGHEDGMTAYLADLLATARRHEVLERVRADSALLLRLVDLLGNPDTALSVRIGIMATFEEFEGNAALEPLVGPLIPHTSHVDARVRADACHALTLTGSARALPALQACVDDPDPEVRETAADGVELLERAV
jgi:thiol-disulfide isomerase/thioredoxin